MTESVAEVGAPHATHEVSELSASYEIGKLGMWIFLAGETMLFGGLMGVFTLVAFSRGGWGSDGAHVNWRLAGINTIILFTSSMTAALAQGAARSGDLARGQALSQRQRSFGRAVSRGQGLRIRG